MPGFDSYRIHRYQTDCHCPNCAIERLWRVQKKAERSARERQLQFELGARDLQGNIDQRASTFRHGAVVTLVAGGLLVVLLFVYPSPFVGLLAVLALSLGVYLFWMASTLSTPEYSEHKRREHAESAIRELRGDALRNGEEFADERRKRQ